MKNIICIEGEWEFNSQPAENRFSLNTEPLLHWLREFYSCDTVYRHILTKEDLLHYIQFFASHKRQFKGYEIIYISCHGWNHSLSLEGGEPAVDLAELAEMAGNFFEGRIVHFGSCKTMSNADAVLDFMRVTGAKLVSGYEVSVDPTKSAIADIAYFNELMNLENVGVIKNANTSRFRKTYASLLDELRFVAY